MDFVGVFGQWQNKILPISNWRRKFYLSG